MVLDEPWRWVENVYSSNAAMYPMTYLSYQNDYGAGNVFYDATNRKDADWFRFDAPTSGGTLHRMPTEAPGYLRCGTQYPGWLRAQHPMAGEPIDFR